MKNKNILLTIFSLMASVMCLAQPGIKFRAETQMLGSILWDQPVSITYELTNIGNSPLVIEKVVPGCACTLVTAPSSPVLPGKTAKIQAVFDAKALGTFYKDIAVYTNAQDKPVYVDFTGRVVATPDDVDMTMMDGFDIVMEDARISTSELDFGAVSKGDVPQMEISILNTGRAPFTPQLMHVPSYLDVKYVPEKIQAGRVGKIIVSLKTDELPDKGLTEASVYFSRHYADEVGEENEIPVSAILLPDFSNVTPQSMAFSPKGVLSTGIVKLKPGTGKTKATIQITNQGRQKLVFDRIQVSSPAISMTLPSREIAPGGKVKMKVTVDPAKLKKNHKARILLITNDPQNPLQTINITN